MFVMVEASETTAETFQQLKTRTRNKQAMSADLQHDWRRGIVETNPGAGWIRTDFLLNSARVQTHGSSLDQYAPSLTPDRNLSTHITSTDANRYLPPSFVNELVANRPHWWVSKFVYGSFSYSEGLVYPSYSKAVVPAFPVPRHWKRIVAADYGLSDKFSYLAAAIDQDNGICYFYKNYATNDRNIEFLASKYFEFTADIPAGGLLTAPIMDPKSGPKRDYDKKSLYSHFLDHNIAFQPGHVSVDARVYRSNTYFESGKVKIMDDCIELITELSDYRFPERSLNATMHSDKPIDKNNHSINPMEWILMWLPADPRKLILGAFRNHILLGDMQADSDTNHIWQLDDGQSKEHNIQPDVFYLPTLDTLF